MNRVIALTLALAGIAAAPAHAGTVKVYEGTSITFTDRSGARNVVTVTQSRRTFTVRDRAATLVAGKGCVSRGAHEAVCKVDLGFNDISLVLGRGNDSADMRTVKDAAKANGGAGDDVIRGSNSFDALDGGGGSDRLYGNGGNDILEDGDKRATGGGKDLLNGGAEIDEVDYSNRGPAALTIDLPNREGIGGDTIKGVEGVTTGAGDDEIAGDDGDNQLYAGGGRNVLFGGPGADELVVTVPGGELNGQEGDDEIRVEKRGTEPASTLITCGEGTDSVSSFPTDLLNDGACEYAVAGKAFVNVAALEVRNGNSLRFPVSCANTDYCSGFLELRQGDVLVSTSEEYEVNDDGGSVRFPLDQDEAQRLAKGEAFTIRGPDEASRGFTTFLQG